MQSGLILDFYDDPRGIRAVFASVADVPLSVKTAHRLTPEETEELPDSVFALALSDGASMLRKYACIDRGNTELHVGYFLKHAGRLEPGARQTAARNLVAACGWYDIEAAPELQKEALGLVGAANLALVAPSVAKGTQQKVRSNLQSVRALEGPPGQIGGQVVPPAASEALLKGAEALDLQPYVQGAGTPQVACIERSGSVYALGQAFPLDSYLEVKRASAYFDEFSTELTPAERHEFSARVSERAGELGIEVSDRMKKLGARTYAPVAEISAALDLRRQYLPELGVELLDELLEKRAEISPDVFVRVLAAVDELGMVDWRYGSTLLDPYESTYGVEKRAGDDVWLSGSDYLTKAQIEDFGKTGYSSLVASYGDEFSEEFRKDPWGVFQSLPLDQKRRLARMATDNSPTGKTHVAS